MTRRDIIAIGGSIGAIDAVRQLCSGLPAELAATLFIVIHVGDRGRNLIADIFAKDSAIGVSTAVDGERLKRGHVYVAAAGHHLLVMGDVLRLGRGPRENMARPAIDPLFRSIGVSFGSRAIGVVLTGMLNDGAAGLVDIKRCGGITVVQNPDDCVAAEMPMGALHATDVDYRTPISGMAELLASLLQQEIDEGPPVPADIQIEIDIALGRTSDSAILSKFADAVPLSCPACGGVLSQIRQGPPLRFRCQVGHAYTAETLHEEKEGDIDEALRIALRIVEERAVLTEKMAQEARMAGRDAAALTYLARTKDCRAKAGVLRRAIASHRI